MPDLDQTIADLRTGNVWAVPKVILASKGGIRVTCGSLLPHSRIEIGMAAVSIKPPDDPPPDYKSPDYFVPMKTKNNLPVWFASPDHSHSMFLGPPDVHMIALEGSYFVRGTRHNVRTRIITEFPATQPFTQGTTIDGKTDVGALQMAKVTIDKCIVDYRGQMMDVKVVLNNSGPTVARELNVRLAQIEMVGGVPETAPPVDPMERLGPNPRGHNLAANTPCELPFPLQISFIDDVLSGKSFLCIGVDIAYRTIDGSIDSDSAFYRFDVNGKMLVRLPSADEVSATKAKDLQDKATDEKHTTSPQQPTTPPTAPPANADTNKTDEPKPVTDDNPAKTEPTDKQPVAKAKAADEQPAKPEPKPDDK